jgi:hypothetical protein
MKMKTFKVFLLGSIFLLLSSCAFSTSTVKIDYVPQDYSVHVDSSNSIFVQKLSDVRGVEPTLLSYKGVQYKTSGKYVTDREISDILTDALQGVLTKMGYHLVENGSNVTLKGDILKIDSQVLMGFWSGEMEATIQLSLKLIDSKSGAIIWDEVLTGNGKKTGLQIDREEHRKEVTEKALDSLMTKIATSTSLRDAVAKSQPKML